MTHQTKIAIINRLQKSLEKISSQKKRLKSIIKNNMSICNIFLQNRYFLIKLNQKNGLKK